MEKLKNNKNLIALIIIVVIIALIFIVININKGGKTVNKNETLKIQEKNKSVSIKVDSIDEPVYFSSILSDETAYTGVKLSVTNNSNESVDLLSYNFELLDSNDNSLASVNTGLQDYNVEKSVDKDQLLASKISAGQTVSGYIYFETDSKDISKIRVKCPTDKKTNNHDTVLGQDVYFEYYYINLK